MLYGDIHFDPEHTVIVFVHIPKTGGISFKVLSEQEWGNGAVVRTRMQRFDKVYRSPLHALHTHLRLKGSAAIAKIVGSHPLWPKNFNIKNINNIRLIIGHFRLGDEPATGKKPLYISVVRNPLDRFISEYYYLGHQLKSERRNGRRVNPRRVALSTLNINEYAKWFFEESRNSWNIQCQYLSGSKQFSRAKKTIDDRIFLCAPLERFDDFLEIITKELNLKNTERTEKQNIGSSRPKNIELSNETKELINLMYDQDKLLYQYVCESFDAI